MLIELLQDTIQGNLIELLADTIQGNHNITSFKVIQ
uniref:Uncharacterized protein n=1 Tax=Arundo donax TaxID=35708 RepID=A0A0A8ZIC2_ARUDO